MCNLFRLSPCAGSGRIQNNQIQILRLDAGHGQGPLRRIRGHVRNRFLLTDEATGELKPRGNKIISNTPTHKFGKPEDLVGTMLYLLSDMSSFVTGIVIPVDGGYSAYGGV